MHDLRHENVDNVLHDSFMNALLRHKLTRLNDVLLNDVVNDLRSMGISWNTNNVFKEPPPTLSSTTCGMETSTF